MANVGVYSCISTKASSTSSDHLYSVVLWICKNKKVFFSFIKMILSPGDTCYLVFDGSVT